MKLNFYSIKEDFSTSFEKSEDQKIFDIYNYSMYPVVIVKPKGIILRQLFKMKDEEKLSLDFSIYRLRQSLMPFDIAYYLERKSFFKKAGITSATGFKLTKSEIRMDKETFNEKYKDL